MFRIYYDVTGRGAHYGCQLENEKKDIREIERNKLANLIAYFEVQLNDDVDINTENLNKIIEEGFKKIDVPEDKKQYDETVTNGTFKLLGYLLLTTKLYICGYGISKRPNAV